MHPQTPYRHLPYTVAFLLPQDALQLVTLQRRRLAGCCHRFDPTETLHLTIKYLGYPSERFSEKAVKSFIPRISDLLRKFIPVRISIRGIDIFGDTDDPERDPVIFLKVLDTDPLRQMHDILRRELGNSIEPFPHADGANFRPHITISKQIDRRKLPMVRRLIYRSHKASKREFLLSNLVLFTPNATYPILPHPLPIVEEEPIAGE